MSGSTIGGVIGAVIGFWVGGPAGAQWGWMIGGVAGGLLMPPEIEGPRLDDLRPQGSEYGRPIPIVYGTAAVQGNVIWQSDLIEREAESGGKGEPSQTNFNYFANFAVLLCEGETSLGRIWAGPEKRLIYDGAALEGGTITFYNGSVTQDPDPLMESYLGVGNVPAYRGYAYIVVQDFPVANDGNRIPFLTVEVGNVSTGASLGIVWNVGDIFVDEAAGTYSVSFSGSHEGVITRTLALNTFVASHLFDSGYVGNVNSFFDPDRDRIFYIDSASIFWAETLTNLTGSFDVFGTWPGLPGGTSYRPVGGVYQNGAYYILMHNTGGSTGVAISVLDPDDLTSSLGFYTGDAGFASSGLTHFCARREEGDSYILGATTAGTVRKYPLSAGFTSVSCGACVVGAEAVAIDPNTGYVWSCKFNTGTANFTVAVNDPVTETQLYTAVIPTTAFSLNNGGTRGERPFVFGNGRVIVLFTKWLAKDYFLEFTDDGVPDWFSQEIIGRYHGTGHIGSGFYNTLQNKYWFMRSYAWMDAPLNPGNDLEYVSLWGTDGPATGFYLGDYGVLPEGELLSDIITDLCVRAELDPSEIDVSDLVGDLVDGYAIASQTTVRGGIQVLQPAFYFDVVESGGVAKFVKRGAASVVTIPDAELGAYNSGSEPDTDLLMIQRQMEDELPSVLTVSYMNRALNYEPFTKQARRLLGGSGDEQAMSVPIVMSDTMGQEVADINLHKAWVGRKTYTFNLPLKYTYLEPTDRITVSNQVMMLTKIAQGDGVLKCEGVFDDYSYTAHVVVTESESSGGTGSTVFVPSPTLPVLMNLVALRDTDTDAGFYASAVGTAADNWRGGVLYQSKDSGASYNLVGSFSTPAKIGTTTDVLATYAGGDAIDTVSTVNVVMAGGGELSSTTEDGFLAGTNSCAIGDPEGDFEVVFFRYATLELDGSYTLNRFLRGRRGSGYAIATHAIGDSFVLLSTTTTIRIAAQPADIGQTYLYKAVSVGSSLADTDSFEFINTGRSYSPAAPIDVAQPATLYGNDATTSTGLTWGYYGGAKRKADGTIVLIAAGTVALTDNATNYIYATDAGVVTVVTVAPGGWPAPLAADATALYEVTTVGGFVTNVVDYRTAGGGSTGGGVALNTVNVFTKNQSVDDVNLTDGANIAVDASLSNNFNVTLGGNRTLDNPTNLTAGMVLNFNIHQDGTGARTLTFGNLYKFPGGVHGLSATASAKDFMSCYYDGTILKCNISKAYQ